MAHSDNDHQKNSDHGGHHGSHGHFVMPDKMAFTVWGALVVLTIVTVAVAKVDLGPLNLAVAIIVATVKASLVGAFFMGLKYDKRENAVIFLTSFLFLAIFLVLTTTDLFFRGDVKVKGPLIAEVAPGKGKAKFTQPWVVKPEMITHAKTLFAQQCAMCHGNEGKGDGPAAAALNPRPRNFAATEGWKNGRKPSQIYKTLNEGIKGSGMPAFTTIPADERWALAHFVQSMGSPAVSDTPADLAAVGVDPSKADGGGTAEAASIPVEVAMQRMTEEDARVADRGALLARASGPKTAGGQLYEANCLSCHGATGSGGLRVQAMGVAPAAHIVTKPFSAHSDSVNSLERFSQVVSRGIPGNLMPGFGNLSSTQMRDLHEYVRNLPGSR